MRSAFALRIISGKNILFVNRENLRIFPIYFFTGRGWERTPQSPAATVPPKGEPYGDAAKFPATAKAVPLRADFPRPGEDVA